MRVYRSIVEFRTTGPMKYYDITSIVRDIIAESSIRNGIVFIHAVGATPAVLLVHREHLDKIDEYAKTDIPVTGWLHGNAYAHLRSSIIGTSLIIPVINGKLWIHENYRIYYLETRPVHNHRRKIVVFVKGL